MLLFERRGDKLGFRMADASATQPNLDPPELDATMDSLKQAVEDMLIAQGLYQDEAQAMFETWRDSWFEEGSRLLYIVPRQFVDGVLPSRSPPLPRKPSASSSAASNSSRPPHNEPSSKPSPRTTKPPSHAMAGFSFPFSSP